MVIVVLLKHVTVAIVTNGNSSVTITLVMVHEVLGVSIEYACFC